MIKKLYHNHKIKIPLSLGKYCFINKIPEERYLQGKIVAKTLGWLKTPHPRVSSWQK